jgi:hypothetical protein
MSSDAIEPAKRPLLFLASGAGNSRRQNDFSGLMSEKGECCGFLVEDTTDANPNLCP